MSFPPQNMGPGLATATSSGMAETVERLWSETDVRAAAVVGGLGHLQKGAGGVWDWLQPLQRPNICRGLLCSNSAVPNSYRRASHYLKSNDQPNGELLKLPTGCPPAAGFSSRLFQCTGLRLTSSCHCHSTPKRWALSFKD